MAGLPNGEPIPGGCAMNQSLADVTCRRHVLATFGCGLQASKVRSQPAVERRLDQDN
jgi:hypothetical protein